MVSRVEYQQKKRRKKKLRFRKWVIVVFLIFFFSIFAFSAYRVYAWYNDNKKVDNLTEKLNLNIQKDFVDSDITNLSGAGSFLQELHCVRNADSSIFKFYGHIQFNNVAPQIINFKINNTGLTIPQQFNVNGISVREEYMGAAGLDAMSMSQNIITFNTDGTVSVRLEGIASNCNFVRFNFIACLIFNQNFGD